VLGCTSTRRQPPSPITSSQGPSQNLLTGPGRLGRPPARPSGRARAGQKGCPGAQGRGTGSSRGSSTQAGHAAPPACPPSTIGPHDAPRMPGRSSAAFCSAGTSSSTRRPRGSSSPPSRPRSRRAHLPGRRARGDVFPRPIASRCSDNGSRPGTEHPLEGYSCCSCSLRTWNQPTHDLCRSATAGFLRGRGNHPGPRIRPSVGPSRAF
jgi:hypothetical protein